MVSSGEPETQYSRLEVRRQAALMFLELLEEKNANFLLILRAEILLISDHFGFEPLSNIHENFRKLDYELINDLPFFFL